MQNAAQDYTEPSRRRSTRIMQAVPLVVTGVDALGRPFQERTSTAVINCHGCRYQSKHYVLKNMWVTLEVPHPETGQPPRRVRARVAWILRPRTVRELFQIAVELETIGNLWGIAFPPPDWSPFLQSAEPEMTLAESPIPPEAEATLEELSETAGEGEPLDNLRVLPGPGVDPAFALARQMARMLGEARQQIHSAVREAAAQEAAAEMRPLVATVESQLRDAAHRVVRDALTAEMEPIAQQTIERMREASRGLVQSLREEWSREAETRMADADRDFPPRLSKIAKDQAATFEESLAARMAEAIEQLQKRGSAVAAAGTEGENLLSRLRQTVEESADAAARHLQSILESKSQEARARLADVEKTAQRIRDEIAADIAASQETWRARLEKERSSATELWREGVENSIADAAARAAQRLAQQNESAAQQFEQELALRLSAQRQAFDELAARTQSALEALRATVNEETARAQAFLGQIRETVERMESRGASLEEMSRSTAAELQKRFDAILAAGSEELSQRAEFVIARLAERLQPAIESAGQETLERLARQMGERLKPEVDLAKQMAETLSAQTASVEQTMREHEERLRESAETAGREGIARVQDALSRLERDFEEAGRAAVGRWLQELDTRATDATHTTYEALYKASSWYEKKIQTQAQAALEDGIEQAQARLREKAGEISGLFASELDHYRRSYVEHAQEQLNEAAAQARQRTREQLEAAGGETAARVQKEIRQTAEEELLKATSAAGTLAQQFREQAEATGDKALSSLQAEIERAAADSQRSIAEKITAGISKAQRDLETHLSSLLQALRDERTTQEHQFAAAAGNLSDAGIARHQDRLENASNAILAAAAASLMQSTQRFIDDLAQSSEERLRSMASQLFAGIGESLRERLQDLSASTLAGAPQTEKTEKKSA